MFLEKSAKQFENQLLRKYVILFLLIPSLSQSEDNITGAFGIKFSTAFDTSKALGKVFTKDGVPMYRINTPGRFMSFNKFYVMISPKSQLIYGISAKTENGNMVDCHAKQEEIMTHLSRKHRFLEQQSELASDQIILMHDHIIIQIYCDEGFREIINLSYIDKRLKRKAEIERIELKINSMF